MICIPAAHFELCTDGAQGIKVTPQVQGMDAIVCVETWHQGEGTVVVQIGQEIRQNDSIGGRSTTHIGIKNCHLWDGVNDPFLYTVTATLMQNGKAVDKISARFGCRTFHIDPEKGFFLNGRSYPLVQTVLEQRVRTMAELLAEGVILRPALRQMEELEQAVQRENPAMLEVNRAIAQATEQNYKISKLRSNGLLDDDACSARLAALEAQLTQLRAKRRRLLKNDDVSEAAEALRQTAEAIRQGPERLEKFDGDLFAGLVERITTAPTGLRFHLYGGFEVTEQLWEDGK